MTDRIYKVLVVDDEPSVASLLSSILTKSGFEVDTALSGEQSIRMLEQDNYDIALVDMVLPGINGIELLRRMKEIKGDLIVIMLSAYGTVENTAEAIRSGAYDYLSKPFKKDALLSAIRKAIESRAPALSDGKAEAGDAPVQETDNFVYKSRQMSEIVQLAQRVASSDVSSVMIRGETGVGKEVLARYIHAQSQRRDRPFIEINCAAIPETLLENELFGHERGAYTDARERKQGLFEVASGGIIFLDEIGETSLSIQAKLLKVVEDRSFLRIGGTKKISTDVQIVVATNQDLEELIRQGSFRQDLYYRLKVLNILIPPLRERLEDIMYLADYFRMQYNRQFNKNVKDFTEDVRRIFLNYQWPGNVREMKNTMERLILLADEETITVRQIPTEIFGSREKIAELSTETPSGAENIKEFLTLKEVERQHIKKALRLTNNNKSQAAKILGISRKNLWQKLTKYNNSRD